MFDANELFSLHKDGGKNQPICIILSDGRFNKDNVRPFLTQANENGYIYLFVILDNYGNYLLY